LSFTGRNIKIDERKLLLDQILYIPVIFTFFIKSIDLLYPFGKATAIFKEEARRFFKKSTLFSF